MDTKTLPPVPTEANTRVDFLLIERLVQAGSTVIDVGCGDGTLLQLLQQGHNIRGCGIELSHAGVSQCVSKGLAVVQGDADLVLGEYPDNAFDYAILSHTLQATRKPRVVLSELLRIASKAIVSFHNFGFWKIRLQLLMSGRMPIYDALPYAWYETPNIHFCTIRDFEQLCAEMQIRILQSYVLRSGGTGIHSSRLKNVLGEQALFLISR
jgi:methionine biosynthesis protein MetW